MTKVLSRDAIQRMISQRGGTTTVSGGGGEDGVNAAWVEGSYVAKNYWNQLFTVHGKRVVTVTDGTTGEETVTEEELTLPPNMLPSSQTVTDEETGDVTVTEVKIVSLQVKAGIWTNSFVSALGLNSEGGGGGGADLNALLASINNSAIGSVTPGASNVGKCLVWTADGWAWGTTGSGGGGTVTAITAGTGLSGGTITTAGTISISNEYQTRIAHGQQAWQWGNHANMGYLTSSDIADMATKSWVENQGFVTSSGVTSVGLSVPTGFTVSGSPVTTSGTLALGIANGYSLPTTAKQSQWDTAYNQSHTHSNKNILDGITQIKVDKWDNDYVTLATSQTISGIKTFSTGPILNNATPILVRDTDGTVRSAFELDQNNIFAIGYGVRNLTGSSTHLYSNSYIRFNLNGSVSTKVTPNGLVIGNDGNETTDTTHYLQIGGGKLCWDNTNNALYVQKADGTAAHFYATGGVSALGMSVGGTPSMNALTLQTLTVNGSATIANLTVRNTISSLTVDDLDVSNNLYMNGCDISMDAGNINNCSILGADAIETGTLLVGSGSEVKKIQWDGTYLQVQIGTTTYKFRPDATA